MTACRRRLDHVILLVERHLRQSVREFVEHDHRERNHQGLWNELIETSPTIARDNRRIRRMPRLGGSSIMTLARHESLNGSRVGHVTLAGEPCLCVKDDRLLSIRSRLNNECRGEGGDYSIEHELCPCGTRNNTADVGRLRLRRGSSNASCRRNSTFVRAVGHQQLYSQRVVSCGENVQEVEVSCGCS